MGKGNPSPWPTSELQQTGGPNSCCCLSHALMSATVQAGACLFTQRSFSNFYLESGILRPPAMFHAWQFTPPLT